jgi:transformer-2 protein
MDYENESRGYDDGESRDQYQRDDRSLSPRRRDSPPRRDRNRSASPGRMGDRAGAAERSDDRRPGDDMSNASDRGGDRRNNGPAPDATNTGTNLFVTGIHPRLTEDDVMRLFAKYGEVEKCQIMLDPHTKESRGFGFVKMSTLESADAAKEGLQGETFEGRTLSIEKARRSRPRTPTPGKYFGPPKRDDFRRGPPGRFGDDRRPPRGGRYYDDYDRRGGGGYSSRYDDRDAGERHYRSRDSRDDYGGPRAVDRYAGREDRYGGSGGARGEDRYSSRGGDDRRAPRESYAYGDRDSGYSRAPPSDAPPRVPEGGRSYGGYEDDRSGYRR